MPTTQARERGVDAATNRVIGRCVGLAVPMSFACHGVATTGRLTRSRMPATLPIIMFTRSTTLACLTALSIASCGGERTAAARERTPQLSLEERDAQMEREQVHAATFAVGDPVRIRDTDARTYLRGQTGKSSASSAG